MDMTRKLILAAWALLFAAAVPAQQKEEFRLWPEAGKYAPERLGAGFDRDNAPAVVLKYTMPHGNYDLPRRDVQQAIELVRANAAGWGVDPARVGVIGFSAG